MRLISRASTGTALKAMQCIVTMTNGLKGRESADALGIQVVKCETRIVRGMLPIQTIRLRKPNRHRKGLGMEHPRTTKNVGQPCVICGQPANAQATVEALQAIIMQMGEQAAVLAKDGMAAKAQVAALQRELDHAKKMEAVQKEVADNQTWRVCKRNVEKARQKKKRYRASLDATTPDSNQLGDLNDMVSKGGDGE